MRANRSLSLADPAPRRRALSFFRLWTLIIEGAVLLTLLLVVVLLGVAIGISRVTALQWLRTLLLLPIVGASILWWEGLLPLATPLRLLVSLIPLLVVTLRAHGFDCWPGRPYRSFPGEVPLRCPHCSSEEQQR